MTSKQNMIRDIVEEYGERVNNIKRYYPYFRLLETNFSQYKDGKYEKLDMGYFLMSILRFFIEENNFNEKYVSYAEYAAFVTEVLRIDFELLLDTADEEEIASYIFDKIKNDGKPFAFQYYDPLDHKKKTVRMKLLENHIQNDMVYYSITADAIEFYLDTKEVRDESAINIEQLLLEKLIDSQNFRGAVEVVRRINNEVSKMQKRKTEVLHILSFDVFAGVKAYEEFVESGIRWFKDEQKLFRKNMELIEKALKRATLDGDNGAYKSSYYQSVQDIYQLETELKKAINKHSELLMACTDLQIKADEIVSKAKLSALRLSFDFKSVMHRLMEDGTADQTEQIAGPFLGLHTKKTFNFQVLDDLLTYKGQKSERGEALGIGEEEMYVFDDEIEDQRINGNYSLLLETLFNKLLKGKAFTLRELNETLGQLYGEALFRNGDYYSFFVHLCQKKEYRLVNILKKPDTFLEQMIVEYVKSKPKHSYHQLAFELIMPVESETVTISEVFEMTNVTFRLLKKSL